MGHVSMDRKVGVVRTAWFAHVITCGPTRNSSFLGLEPFTLIICKMKVSKPWDFDDRVRAHEVERTAPLNLVQPLGDPL
jgi:hypothetical protein